MSENKEGPQEEGRRGVSVRRQGKKGASVRARGLSSQALGETFASLLEKNPKMTMQEAMERIEQKQQRESGASE